MDLCLWHRMKPINHFYRWNDSIDKAQDLLLIRKFVSGMKGSKCNSSKSWALSRQLYWLVSIKKISYLALSIKQKSKPKEINKPVLFFLRRKSFISFSLRVSQQFHFQKETNNMAVFLNFPLTLIKFSEYFMCVVKKALKSNNNFRLKRSEN